ncbi:transposase [Acetobacter senegalensis]|uniref:transposase n=1 Tax=Acetobacter senegalensis TaxID=446692 RepID=UPI001C3E8628
MEERDRREALGCSRGGYGMKVCVIADGYGKAFGFALAPGQAHELLLVPAMLDNLPAIPAKRRDGAVACPNWAYRCRYLVENLWAHVKDWHTIVTRYEKTATSFFVVIHIAAAADWIKP